MERNIISFSANQQELIKTGGISHYASNVVGYIVAEFDLGENWTEFDSVRAVFKSDYETVPAVLSHGACVIPFEVLKRRSTVKVNLVGSVAESNVLVDRLTSYPITALVVDANATVDNDIEPITPTEFEQFVAAVKADADRAEAGAESAEAAVEDAEASEQAALGSAQAAAASALNAENSASDASNYADRVAQMVAEVIAEIEEFEGVTVTVETLPAGSQATASFADGVLHLGIPKGDKGDQGERGERGETGATGATGATGNGIASITLTSTSGAVKTYTILFTDGTSTTFEVTDGEVTQAVLDETVSDLKADLTKVSLDTLNVLEGKIVGFLNSSGNFSPSATIYSHTDFIKVNAGDEFKYKLKSASASASIIAFYNSASVSAFVSNVASNGQEQKGTYTAPADGYIIVGWINSFESDLYFYKSNFIPTVITETTKTLIDEPVSDVYKKVYSIKTDGITNGFINGSGDFSANAIYRTSAFLPIKSGESFKYKLSHGTTLPIISFYNNSKVYDSTKSVIGISGYSTGTYTASADGYIRFSYLASRDDVYALFTEIIPDNVLKAFPTNEVPQMNILVLGDSIMGEDDDITNPLSVLSGATVINGAVGGTRATNRGGSDNFQYFDGVNLIQALCTNTWTAQENAVEALKTSYPWFPAKLAVLEDVDMSSVDMILFNWATNDYTASVTMADIVSAHNTIINTIQTYYPSIRIVVISPIWRFFDTEADNKNADNFAFNTNTLKEISNAIVDNAHDKRITVFDAYKNMPLNYKTASLYFNSGSDVHLNAVGGKLFAHYLNGFINSIC